MLTRQQKEKLVKELAENFSQAKAVIFTNPQQLKVKQLQNLRKKLKEKNIHYRVAKKKLFILALEKAELKKIDLNPFKCSIAAAFDYSDEVSPAKIIYYFFKENKQLEILGGILDRNFLDAKSIVDLALLPSKNELLVKLVGSINTPVNNFVSILNGNLRGLVGVLNAIKNAKK